MRINEKAQLFLNGKVKIKPWVLNKFILSEENEANNSEFHGQPEPDQYRKKPRYIVILLIKQKIPNFSLHWYPSP